MVNSCFGQTCLYRLDRLLYQLPFELVFTVWSGRSFAGSLARFTSQKFWGPFAFFGGCVHWRAVGNHFGEKLNYSRTEYKFQPIELNLKKDFQDHQKIIRFRDIKEVTLRRGIFSACTTLNHILAIKATRSLPAPMFARLDSEHIHERSWRCHLRIRRKFQKIQSIVISPNVSRLSLFARHDRH